MVKPLSVLFLPFHHLNRHSYVTMSNGCIVALRSTTYYNLVFFCFYLVPSDLITSVDVRFDPTVGVVGNQAVIFCRAKLTVPLNSSEAILEFDYGFTINSVPAGSGTNPLNAIIISPVSIFSAGEYTCTLTITAPGVCGGGMEPACPTKTSDSVALMVKCEFI